jgi:hypothetical protein
VAPLAAFVLFLHSAIFLIPVTFYVIERLFAARKEKPLTPAVAKLQPEPEPAIKT